MSKQTQTTSSMKKDNSKHIEALRFGIDFYNTALQTPGLDEEKKASYRFLIQRDTKELEVLTAG